MPSPANSPAAAYEGRRDERAAVVARLTRRHEQLANARLLVAGIGAVGLWLAFRTHTIAPAWLTLPLLAFAILAWVHDRVLRARRDASRAVRVYEDGLARIEDRWSGRGSEGAAYLSADHPYAADLDLFGPGSLFQLMSTARLPAGEAVLAAWLLAPAEVTEIHARHAAIEDLRGRVDLRERLAVAGDEVAGALQTAGLAAWGGQPPILTAAWPRVAAPALAVCNIAALAAGFFRDASSGWIVLSGLVSILFSYAWSRRVRRVLAGVNAPARALRLLSEILTIVEREPVQAPRLRALHDRLQATGDTASHRIAQLTRLVDLTESRRNQIFAPIAMVVLAGTQLAWAIEAWRRRSGAALGEWLSVAGEFEAFNALAGYAYEHPDDPFPDVQEGPGAVHGSALAHPLLPAARVVPNDVTLDASTRVLVVSGSNMSGKSTLLRTVGINVVLALAGAPVRARDLRCTPVALGATLRIQDSLQAGRSRFFAEITRLKQIVDLTAGPLPVLFLLDELLAGTNSHDRRVGAAGILRGLISRGAIGLITTHDLALAEVAADVGLHAANVHFSDTFEAGEVHFDYRMRPGVVRTSNALALMRSIGLEVEEQR